jgi:hypothetical protein
MQVELAGRSWLTGQLVRSGLEVARPERDRGIDLIVYRDRADEGDQRFTAYPIQMKAAMSEVFSLDPKYEYIPRLIMVYVWHLWKSSKTICYAMTYPEALQIAEEMGYTKTASWMTGAKTHKRGYSTTKPSKRLKLLLRSHLMTPRKWEDLVNDSI